MATPVLMPKQGNSVESCLIIAWKKHVGEAVRLGEVLLDVETDKAVIEVESPAEGILLETFYNPDDEVPVQTVIAVIGSAGEDISAFKANKQETVSIEKKEIKQPKTPARSVAAISTETPGAISPRARALAKTNNLSVEGIAGTGPQGRIIERDIQRALNQAATKGDGQPEVLAEGVTAIPLTAVRKRIASRMLESLQTTAQLTLNAFADATELLHYRQRFKESAIELELSSISLNDLILFAVSRSLTSHPDLNALFEHDTIYQHDAVHLGFAVDTPRGLLVPVIKNANDLSLKTLSKKAKLLADACQSGKIAPENLQGSSFTVSNLGAFGVETFTPILNPPQVAILGVGSIDLKAVSVEGRVEHVPHLSLSLTVNHQVIDGAPAARFLQTLSQNLSSISSLLLS